MEAVQAVGYGKGHHLIPTNSVFCAPGRSATARCHGFQGRFSQVSAKVAVNRVGLGFNLSVEKGLTNCASWRKKFHHVSASYESSSGGGNSHVEDGDNGTVEYLEAQVMDAVSMVPLQGKLLMTFGNGKEMEVDHINPAKGRLLYKSSTPTIFLKVTDGSNLMLPIVVGEAAVNMLMKALHDDDNGRPNFYHLMRDLVGSLQYEARMVRITERVVDTYYSRIYIAKPGEAEGFSLDARPSDAINFAVRCKAPIYVNSTIIRSDAVRPVTETEFSRRVDLTTSRKRSPLQIATSTDELTMLIKMQVAITEERYFDAAHWRDELMKLRSKRRLI